MYLEEAINSPTPRWVFPLVLLCFLLSLWHDQENVFSFLMVMHMKQTWKKQHLEKNYHAKCYSFKSRRAKLPGEKVKLIWLKLRIQVGLEIRICMVCDYEFGDHLTFCKVICDDKYLSSMSTAFRYFLSNIFCSPQLIFFLSIFITKFKECQRRIRLLSTRK